MISESPTIALFSGRREYVATLRWFFFFFETTHYVGLLSVITDRAGVICPLLPCCRVMMSWRPVHRATQTVKDPNRLNNKDRPLLCPLLIRIRVVLFFKFFHIRSASPVLRHQWQWMLKQTLTVISHYLSPVPFPRPPYLVMYVRNQLVAVQCAYVHHRFDSQNQQYIQNHSAQQHSLKRMVMRSYKVYV